MTLRLALAGDTMLGRKVGTALAAGPERPLLAPEVVAAAAEADLFVLNLECCISDRGSPWPDPAKPFFFRAPPLAAELLASFSVDCVTLANNHALDFGEDALIDTFEHLRAAGIAWTGAGADVNAARGPAVLQTRGTRLAVIGVCDHPAEFAAGTARPGVAFADFRSEPVPEWLATAIAACDADLVLVSPHWGPNMATSPVRHVRSAAAALVGAGATLVAGHSAHVFQGVAGAVLYDLGDFLDDYAVDPVLRNDLGLLFLVELDEHGPIRLEALPLELDYCHTRLAGGEGAAWVQRRFRAACAELGTDVTEDGGRLVVTWR